MAPRERPDASDRGRAPAASGAQRPGPARVWAERVQEQVASCCRLRARAWRCAAGAAALLGLVVLLHAAHPGSPGAAVVFALAAGGVAAVGASVRWLGTADAEHKRVVDTLGRARWPEAAGRLALYCHHRDDAWARAAARSLLRVLPHVSSEHAAHIRADETQALARLLRRPDREMAVAVLGALRRVGGASALPDVRRLAQWPDALDVYSRQANVAPDVRQAAHVCLAWIEARQAREGDHARLLRPAAPPDGAESLLRPASPAGEVPDEALLRPAEPGA